MAARHTGQAPYGFRWKDERLVADPNESAVRCLAFELFLEHRRKGTVARELNERGHRSRRGSKWRDVTVGRLLTCPSAKGIYIVNKTMQDAEGHRVDRPENEWEYLFCETIVTEALWEEVNTILAEQAEKAGPPHRKSVQPFGGLVVCGRCGEKMSVPKSNAAKFVCTRSGCGQKFPIADLEEIFMAELAEYLGSRKEALGQILASDAALTEAQAQHDGITREIERLEDEIGKTHHLYLKNQITTERYGQLHQPLEERLKVLKSEAVKCRRQVDRLTQRAADEDSLNIQALLRNWPTLSAQHKRQVAELLLSQIVIDETEIEFSYTFTKAPSPPNPTPTPVNQQPTGSPEPKHSPGLPPSPDNTSAVMEGQPQYIRLPKSGQLCPYSGLTRSKLNELILPTPRNGHNPQVASKSLRTAGQKRGVRLILLESLMGFLQGQK